MLGINRMSGRTGRKSAPTDGGGIRPGRGIASQQEPSSRVWGSRVPGSSAATRCVYALEPRRALASLDASRDTLGKARVKLIDLVDRVRTLTGDAPYAVVGGLAQILWARKTHTDDLDVALTGTDVTRAYERVRGRRAGPGWRLPRPPDRVHEQSDVFEVYHLLFRGAVVDLMSFRDEEFTAEILATALPVPELRDIRFIRPELLLVTHCLRPDPLGALAAIELVIARRAAGDLDLSRCERWASRLGHLDALRRTLARADDLERS